MDEQKAKTSKKKQKKPTLEAPAEPKTRQTALPKKKTRKARSRLTDHLIQGLFIFSSVLLAFWLNDLHNRHLEKRTAKAAIEAVVNELEQNKAILEVWTPKHKKIFERVEAFLVNSMDTATVFNPYQFTVGPIMSNIITNDSWDIIRQTNPRIDLDTRLLINRIYRQQEYVDKALDKLTNDFLLQREIYDPEKVRENYLLYYMLIGDLKGQGEAMIREYAYVLEQVRKNN